MNLLRWLSRIEVFLCLAGLGAAFAAAGLLALVESLMGAGHLEAIGWGAIYDVARLGLVVAALFAIGPAATLDSQIRRRRLGPRSWGAKAATAHYATTAAVFFVLFCIASYVTAETRALNDLVAGLHLPLWLMQSLMVTAFGANVLRFSVYAADEKTRPEAIDPLFLAIRFSR